MKDRVLLVNLFYKNDDCVLATLKKFRSLKGIKNGCGPISTKVLKNMIQKFAETGSESWQRVEINYFDINSS